MSKEFVESEAAFPLIGTEALADCKVFSVAKTWVKVRKTDSTHSFYRIDSGEWVNVVSLTPDDHLVMVRQFRHGSRDFTLEIPGGLVDPGEQPVEAAARELTEETGFRAASLRPLGSLNPNPALFSNRVHTFLAEGCEQVGEIENPGLEQTQLELIPAARVPDLLRKGEIDHALVVAALHWWCLDPAGPLAR